MHEFDYLRRFARFGAVADWLAVLALNVSLTFDQLGPDRPLPTSLYVSLIVLAFVVGAGYSVQAYVTRNAQLAVQSTNFVSVASIVVFGSC